MQVQRPSTGIKRSALIRALMILLIVGVVGSPRAVAQEHISREPAIKAAYLYNFAKYITLSQDARQRIPNDDNIVSIGIVGNTLITEQLQSIAQEKTIHGKKIKVSVFASAREIQSCHLLFVPATLDVRQQKEVVDKVGELDTVFVTDSRALAFDAAILIVNEANRLKFEVNLTQVEAKEIDASSKLLRLGRLVRRRSE